ncbi:LysR family transcriptional regulator [Granulicella sp. WH15]|uniref:LysR substrate-binding domain-containing protein n=1 Tax=Granulicella sp. WH15 TaxID=2602070 RepID=UPI001366DB9B|nr:LysR substrate-binding domain-containing protein [Granulicella sp. WH15]QHN04635.1 LysR family transcriptional regulator [Granulicella sp. WH15]
MELRHLRYFCAVAEHGTFSAASRHLHVAQSSISEQIQDLEDEIGVTLIKRGQRATQLTREGLIFLDEAHKTLAAAERAVDTTRHAMQGLEGALTIGFFLWGAGGFFPRLIREYRKLHPNIRLTLVEMLAAQQLEALTTGTIDIGFTRPLEPPFNRTLKDELLFEDPIVAVLPVDHPLAGAQIEFARLAEERFVMIGRRSAQTYHDGIISLCSNAGFSPHIVNSSASWSGILTLVESGEGVALVPAGVRRLRSAGLVFADLLPETAHVGLSVAWNPEKENPVQRDFLQLVRKNKEKIRRSRGA